MRQRTGAAPSRGVVLRYLAAEVRASIRAARRSDLAWVALGGGGLVAYAVGIVLTRISARSEMLLAEQWIWWAALPAAMLLTGALTGWGLARLAQSRANAPFLKTQPLGTAARRRMASFAALALGAPIIAIDGLLVAAMSAAAGQALPVLWGIGAFALAGIALTAAAALRLRRPWHDPAARDHATHLMRRGISLRAVDRRKPSWLGSWASGLVGGRVRLRPGAVLTALGLGVAGAIIATASIVQKSATAGLIGGVVGGLAIFMLTLSCRPLLSPVLRASALTFTRAMRGLVRLPLLLSALFFAALAAPAYAAEPGMMAMPLSGAFGLLALNGIYAVFAAFFAHSRRLAALAFFAALGLTAYETLEYGRTVVIGLAALVIFLWLRARKAYRHG